MSIVVFVSAKISSEEYLFLALVLLDMVLFGEQDQD